MSYCKTCHITYHTPAKRCMFCQNELVENEEKTDSVYHYPEMKLKRQTRATLLRIISFLSVLCIGTVFFVDYCLNKHETLHWSLFVISSVLFVDALIYLLTDRKKMIKKLTTLSYLMIGYLLLLAVISKSTVWAMDFIYPLLLILQSLCVLCYYIFGHKKELHNIAIYLLIPAVLGMLSVIHLFLGNVVYRWPTIVCVVYSLVIVIGLFFFSTNKTKEELKRRFYL